MSTTPKLVIITGADGGLGKALAILLAGKGYRVGLIGENLVDLEEARKLCGGPCASIEVADVTDKEDFARALKAIKHDFQGQDIDVLVNNFGGGSAIKPSKLTVHDVEHMMKVNVYSVMNGIQLVLPEMKQRHTGHIVSVSSIVGCSAENEPLHCAEISAKQFLKKYTESLRAELKQEGFSPEDKSGIIVSSVSPGPVAIDFLYPAKTTKEDTPEEDNTSPKEDTASPKEDNDTTKEDNTNPNENNTFSPKEDKNKSDFSSPAAPSVPSAEAQAIAHTAESFFKLIANRDEECFADLSWYPEAKAAMNVMSSLSGGATDKS